MQGHWDLDLNKLGKRPQGMLHTKIQASEPNGSQKEDFLLFSTHFYDSNLGLSGSGPRIFLIFPSISMIQT